MPRLNRRNCLQYVGAVAGLVSHGKLRAADTLGLTPSHLISKACGLPIGVMDGANYHMGISRQRMVQWAVITYSVSFLLKPIH